MSPYVRRGRLINPSPGAWEALGNTLASLVEDSGLVLLDVRKSFIFDILIAWSCREIGAVLVSRNVWDGATAGTRDSAGVTIVPFMETGATDGLFLRNAGIPVYGVTGIAYDPDDVRAHGKDERILVRSFNEGLEFAYQIAKALAGPSEAAR